jgi:hypothetical protein
MSGCHVSARADVANDCKEAAVMKVVKRSGSKLN